MLVQEGKHKKILHATRTQKLKTSLRSAMATLKRSEKSFRRQGSSGSVWDGKKLTEGVNQLMRKEGNCEDHRQLRPCYSISGGVTEGSLSNVEPRVYARSLSTPSPIVGDSGKLLNDVMRLILHDDGGGGWLNDCIESGP
ncbi:hypothetical protein Ccrd_026832 [Cynara cardunculus var. scolymus]|uniref:Uncharacterized protein n=1 Tax=Cynara cardunculus var. scolymus TaxID=59895 RepID=A0A103XD32_CYNCS|nr:hypothetical protein Ccrd_026832 [Cynara cardunculus var. scolymus]